MSATVYLTDSSDIEKAFVNAITTAIFACSVVNPAVLTPSTLTVNARVFRGWIAPETAQNQIVNAAAVLVSVNSLPSGKLTSRFAQNFQVSPAANAATVALTVTGNTVTITGNGTSGLNLGVAFGGRGWQYRPTASDTARSIANALAAAIPNASVSNTTITLPVANTATVVANVVSDFTRIQETARQCRWFQIDVWAPDPLTRDNFGRLVHGALAAIPYFALANGLAYTQPILFRHASDLAMEERVGVFRRSERYEVEFPTLQQTTVPAILFEGVNVNNTISIGYSEP